jgi:hypothetical protein
VIGRLHRWVHRVTEPLDGPDRVPFGPLLVALVVLAAGIRWGRLPVVWDYWAIDYISYTYGHWDDLVAGRLPWTRLIGMHPGQYALLMALVLEVADSVRALFWIPVLCSVAAIALGTLWVRRIAGSWAGLLVGLLLAISPLQAHYGMELNNYPWFLLVGASLVVLTWANWEQPTAPRLVGLGLAVCAALHTHFFLVPLLGVLGVALAVTRRGRMLAAMGLGMLPALPVLIAAATLPGEPGSYTGEVPAGTILWNETLAAWIGRFGTAHALLGAMLATALGAILALRRPRTRLPALLLLGTIATLTLVDDVGFVTGAARIFQTPYWVLPSWCAFALIGLGTAAAPRTTWLVPLLVLAAWAMESAHRAAWPLKHSQAMVTAWSEAGPERLPSPPDAAPLAAHLDEAFGDGDVLLYLWDPPYINDQPHRHDPLFAALPPADVGPWDPESVNLGFGFRFRGGTAYVHNYVPMRGGDNEAAVGEALQRWLDEGRRIHLVYGNVDPEQPPPDASGLRAAAAAGGGRWQDRFLATTRVTVIEPSGR